VEENLILGGERRWRRAIKQSRIRGTSILLP
jgi:hypothetical protein